MSLERPGVSGTTKSWQSEWCAFLMLTSPGDMQSKGISSLNCLIIVVVDTAGRILIQVRLLSAVLSILAFPQLMASISQCNKLTSSISVAERDVLQSGVNRYICI